MQKEINKIINLFMPESIYRDLEPKAQIALTKYLKTLKIYTGVAEDSKEIYKDIYALIEEKITQAKLQSPNKKIGATEIERILKKIGSPEEILSNNDIDNNALLKTNPLTRVQLQISNFVNGESKSLKIVSIMISIVAIVVSMIIVAWVLSLRSWVRDFTVMHFEGASISYYIKIALVAFLPLILISLRNLWIFIKHKATNNKGYILTILFASLFIIAFMMINQNSLVQTVRSIEDANKFLPNLYRASTDVYTKEDTIDNIKIDIRANQNNDIPEIFLMYSENKRGAWLEMPEELDHYEDQFLTTDIDKNLRFNYNSTFYREQCGFRCLFASSTRPKLYIYTQKEINLDITYVFNNQLGLVRELPIEIHNINVLNLKYSSSNDSKLKLKAVNIENSYISLYKSAELDLYGYAKTLNVTANDESYFNIGLAEYEPYPDFDLVYTGNDSSLALIGFGQNVTLNMNDNANAMYDEDIIKSTKINKNSETAGVGKWNSLER